MKNVLMMWILLQPLILFSIYNPDTLNSGSVYIPENIMREVIKDLERGDRATIQNKILEQKLQKEIDKLSQQQIELNNKNQELLYTRGINEGLKKQLELCREDTDIKLEGLEREKRRSFLNGVITGAGGIITAIASIIILSII